MDLPKKGLYRILEARRSIRRFLDEPVDPEAIRRMLGAACRAPSAHNRQPWRFVVLEQGPTRSALVEAMSARFRADLQADGLPADQIEPLVERGRTRLLEAPILVMMFLTMEDMDEYPDPSRSEAERTMAIQSVALAGGHVLLAAQEEGLGACWVCAPLFVPETVRRELDLPPEWEAQGVIMLGRPDGPGRDRSRKDLEEVVRWR